MTINLFDVDKALNAEDEKLERIRRALDWKFRDAERAKEELEKPIEIPEAGEPPEAH